MTAVVVRCGFCGAHITRHVDAGGEDQPGYCNPQHRKAAQKRRQRRRKLQEQAHAERYLDLALQPGALCPKPFKRVFPTEEVAQTFIDLTFPEDRRLHPYVCRCGAVHIGHPQAKEQQ